MCVVHVRVYVLICVLNYNPPPSPIKLKLLSFPPQQRVLFAALRINVLQCVAEAESHGVLQCVQSFSNLVSCDLLQFWTTLQNQ